MIQLYRCMRSICFLFAIALSFNLVSADLETRSAVTPTDAPKKAVFLFDLGGVCLSKSTFSTLCQVGLYNLVGFYSPFGMESKLFSLLHAVQPVNGDHPGAYHGALLMPQVMCDFLTGTKSSSEIQELLETFAQTKKCRKLFNTKHERDLIVKIAKVIFDPVPFSKVFDIDKHTLKAIKYIRKQSSDHRLYVISNWDKESFDLVKARFPELFDLFDGIIISAEVGCMKPGKEIFAHLFEQFNVDHKNDFIIYVDDEISNIEGASRAFPTITPILFKDGRKLKKALKALGI